VCAFPVSDVTVRPIAADEVDKFNSLLREHHWLGHRLTGQVMRYVAVADGLWVALIGFGSAALSCAARDRYLGWNREQQYTRLRHVVNNQRFCVLPAGRTPNLVSAVLARTLRRLSSDYLAVYGHRALVVETFTDPARHSGACYKASNFIPAGHTLGYARSGGSYRHHGNRKRVWLYQLHRRAPRILSAPFPHPLLSNNIRGVDVNTLPITGDGGLLAALTALADPRKKRGVRHSVAVILTMVAAATLAGNRSFRAVADWVADLPQDALARLGARQRPQTGRYVAPSEATIRRTVKGVDANHVDALIGGWLLEQVHAGRLAAEQTSAFIGFAVDGKTLKGSWPEINTANGKVRLLSALVHGEGVIVGQRAIPAHTNETTQVLPLLQTISGAGADTGCDDEPGLDGAVITADALHVHRDNMAGVLKRNGDYVLTVKNNQPTLRTQIEKMFTGAEGSGSFPPSPQHL
jgi:urease gamma subunit